MMYSRTYLSKEELQQLLVSHVDLLEINRILSAYDMADMAYAEKKSLNGSPYFFHTSRIFPLFFTISWRIFTIYCKDDSKYLSSILSSI